MPVVENHQPDWKQAWLRRLAAPALLLLIVVLFHWKLVLSNQYTWLESPDLSSLVMPWFQFQASEWHAGRFPMWEPYSWTGQPLFGQGQPGAAYPLNWLLFWMPLNGHGWLRQDVLHWYYVLIHVFAAWTSYAFARELGRSRRASIVAGCIYSLAGYVAYTDWPQMLHGAVWAPLVFLYLFRFAKGERVLASSLLSGFFLGLAWLVGHHQLPLLVSLTAGFFWLWLILSEGVRSPKAGVRMLRYAVAAFGITAMTGAFQTLPMAEYGRDAVRWVGAEQPEGLGETVAYELHKPYALKPLSLLGLVIPGVEHNTYDSFVGGVALTLGILGAILAWQDRRARWLAAISLGGILFALGPNSIFHGVLYAVVPMINKARVPAAGALMFTLGLAPLAAFAVDVLPESKDWSRRVGWMLGGCAAVLALGSLFFYSAGMTPAISDNRMVMTALVAVLMAAVLGGWRSGGISARAGTAAILGLVLLELGNVTDYWLPHTSDKARTPYLHKMAQHWDLSRFMEGEGEFARFTYDDKEIPYNIGDWLGVEAFNAYTASVPASLWAHEVFSNRVQDVLGVRYYLGKQPSRPDERLTFQGASGVNVYENPGAFPRVWSVHGARKVASERQAREILADSGFDASNSVFLIGENPPRLGTCLGDEVSMPHHEPNYLKIEAQMRCRGMVILTDTWFPGWRATVDGKRAKIERAYGFVRGVVVEPGSHVVEMRYRPWSVYVGGALSVFACAIVVGVNFGTKIRNLT
ncbi:MAG TPA: YfhO family protein [Bryobacteraceae bacterium]|nr:YfhO family protein [Bryobacteraceae bacterium]